MQEEHLFLGSPELELTDGKHPKQPKVLIQKKTQEKIKESSSLLLHRMPKLWKPFFCQAGIGDPTENPNALPVNNHVILVFGDLLTG